MTKGGKIREPRFVRKTALASWPILRVRLTQHSYETRHIKTQLVFKTEIPCWLLLVRLWTEECVRGVVSGGVRVRGGWTACAVYVVVELSRN